MPFPTRVASELLEKLAQHTGLDRAILGSSGSDAVEAALKTARMATGRSGVLAFEGGYHGLSYGALAATHYKHPAFRRPFQEQLGEPRPTCRLWWTDSRLVSDRRGLGGTHSGPWRNPSTPIGLVGRLDFHSHDSGAVVIFDEVYTGFGRTGGWLRAHAEQVHPDLVCVGKGLAGGLPISACLGTAHVMDAWGASRGEAIHTQTFLGHPLGCAAALACISVLESVIPHVNALGAWVRQQFVRTGIFPPGVLA